MVGKKGYIKTLEAIFAIVLMLIFIYSTIPPKTIPPPKVPPPVTSAQHFIIGEITHNDTLREYIVTEHPAAEDAINDLISEHVPLGYDYTMALCDVTSCVATTPLDKSVYVTDTFIAANNLTQNPRIVRIWFWSLN